MTINLLKNIPSVNDVLESSEIINISEKYSRELTVNSIRKVLDDVRNGIISNSKQIQTQPDLKEINLSISSITDMVIKDIETRFTSTLQRSINATGIILHTGLGRSPIPDNAIARVEGIAKGYSSLEIDRNSGERGSRYNHLTSIVSALTGASDVLLVNNNAAAVLLVLDTLAKGKEVIVSRSQLVEIGGSFRMPDVMEKSGAILVEVGTTNKTYIDDYRKAITERTGLILIVHSSNFRIVGFTNFPEISEIAALGKEHNIPTVYDLGSGAMIDFQNKNNNSKKPVTNISENKLNIKPCSTTSFYEPTVKESVLAGIDITTFSTDKLLGGPQGGLIIGRKDIIDLCKANSLLRALRVDKITIAALDATLRLYLDENMAKKSVPVLNMIFTPVEVIADRVKNLQKSINQISNNFYEVLTKDDFSEIGGGSLPNEKIPTIVLAISSRHLSANKLASRLRKNSPPVFGRIVNDQVLLDLRTVFDIDDENEIINALKKISTDTAEINS